MSDPEQLMNKLKKEVRSVLTPAKEGLTPLQLEQEYRSLMGKNLPFRAHGYHSVIELVKDMPDVVHIHRTGSGSILLKAVADEGTMHIASMIARQKNKPKPCLSRQRLNASFQPTGRTRLRWHSQISLGLPRRGQLPPTLPAIVKSELKELLRLSPVLLSDFQNAFFRHFGRTFDFIRYGFFSMSEVLNAASDIITVVQTRTGCLLTLKDSPPKKQSEKLPKVVQPDQKKQTLPTTVLSPVVNAAPLTPGLSMNDQNKAPEEKSDTSLSQLKMETPLVKSEELQKKMKTELANKGPGGVVSPEFKEKIKTIVAQYPEGLLVSKLSHEFEVHFKEALPLRNLGFLNLMELVGALDDVFRIEYKEGEQDWVIFDVNSQQLTGDEANDKTVQSNLLTHKDTSDGHSLTCWDFPLEDTKNLETKFNVTKLVAPNMIMEEPCIMQEIMENDISPDAVQDRRSLYSLPELDSSLVGVFVENIVSPSQFYVRIYSAETSDKLEDMMIEMRRCYSYKNVSDRYIIPEALIQPGQLCCVGNFKGQWWYRVIIHKVIDDQKVEVFYPDFGNMAVVQKSSLRLLKSCYAVLPAQAIPCSLAWVKPIKDDWTASAVLEFQRLCELKLLVGVVDEYIDGVLHLFLCDTSTDEDIYMHNVLRLEGHAFIFRKNIPSKGFKELNPSTLYIKPSPKQETDLTETAVSLPQQESLGDHRDSEFCRSEEIIQRIDTRDTLAPEQSEKSGQYNCFMDSNSSSNFQETCLFKLCCENSHLEQNEGILKAEMLKEDTTSCSPDSEMPYLEPVYLSKEIWDESWIPSEYCAEKKDGDIVDNLCSDIAGLPNNEENKNESQQSQNLMCEQKEDISGVERIKCLDVSQSLDISEGPETTSSLGTSDTSDSLSQTLEEFYISIAHSKKLGEPDPVGMDVKTCTSPPSTPALYGETSSEKELPDTSKTQVVALCNLSSDRDHRPMDRNAFLFTAELQGSPTFCVSCSPTVALGASARLATSGGCFSFSLRKVKT